MGDRRGGIIPPQGRPPTNPGVGENARRHDLERPKTPGLHDSSLQYGDVSRLEAAQRVAPPLKQRNPTGDGSAVSASRRGAQPAAGSFSVPNPVEFAKQRMGGTLSGAPGGRQSHINPAQWVPIYRRLANAPRSSGILRNALTAQLSTLINNPIYPQSTLIDMDALDQDLENLANGL